MPVILILLLLFSFVPLALTLYRWGKLLRIRRKGYATTGIVISKHTRAVKWGRAVDNLQIEFRNDATGQKHRSHAYSSLGKFRQGDQVTLHYLPEEPGKIVLSGGLGYGPMLIFSIALILFVIFAVYKLEEMIRLELY